MNPETASVNTFTTKRLFFTLVITAILAVLGGVVANGVYKRIYAYAPSNFLQENEVLNAEISNLISSDSHYLGMQNLQSVAFITTDKTDVLTYAYMRIVRADGTDINFEVEFKERPRLMFLYPSAWVIERDPIKPGEWIVLTDQDEYNSDPQQYYAKTRFASMYRWLELKGTDPSDIRHKWSEAKSKLKLLQNQNPST